MDLVREIDAIAVGTDQTRVVAMPLDERSDAAQGQSVSAREDGVLKLGNSRDHRTSVRVNRKKQKQEGASG